MFGTLKELFSPRPVLPSGVPPELRRQMGAVARIGRFNLADRDQSEFCFMMAILGLRLGIDFDRDPDATSKFVVAMETLKVLQENGVDISDESVLNALRSGLRHAGLRF